ncbi:MAG: hypothetical protein LQ347_006923, partial [Umbilicaria vellea]
DAVETLLFMSSPSHSALRTARTLAASPTANANAKKVGFANEEALTNFSSDEDDGGDAPAATGGVALSPMPLSLQSPLALGSGMAVRGGGVRVGLGGRKEDDAIDRMLDGMVAAELDGESSSDDDEYVARAAAVISLKVGQDGGPDRSIPTRKVPTALADHVEKNNLQGKLKYSLFVGASSGAETENRWARLDMIERRSPHQVGKAIAKGINEGRIKFFDKHLSMFPVDLVYGFYTKDKPNNKLDVVIVEASAITEEGGIIPGASVGASPELIQMADKIIIEVNTAMPSFEGLHDITMTDLPPRRKPFLIMAPEDRIGTPYIPVDPEKVVAIVESDYADQTQPNAPEDDTSRAIAQNLIEFLKHEVQHGRLPENLLPIQSGIGNIANAVIGGLAYGNNFNKLKVWTEVLQDSFLDLFDSGNLDFATATSIRFSPDGFKRFYDGWENYHNKLLLRSQQVSNSPEIIRRLGVIGMNTPVEVEP